MEEANTPAQEGHLLRFTYPYIPCPTIYGVVERPYVPIRLEGRTSSVRYLAVVDSGADRSMVPLQTARLLGLPISKSSQRRTRGIGGEIVVVQSLVKLTMVQGANQLTFDRLVVDIPIKNVVMPLLLGREGFLEHFTVCLHPRGCVTLDTEPDQRLTRVRNPSGDP